MRNQMDRSKMRRDVRPQAASETTGRPSIRGGANLEPKPSSSTGRQDVLRGGAIQPPAHRPSVQRYLDQLHDVREQQRQRLFSGGGQPPLPQMKNPPNARIDPPAQTPSSPQRAQPPNARIDPPAQTPSAPQSIGADPVRRPSYGPNPPRGPMNRYDQER